MIFCHEGISRLFEMGRTIPKPPLCLVTAAGPNLKRYTHIRQQYKDWKWLTIAVAKKNMELN